MKKDFIKIIENIKKYFLEELDNYSSLSLESLVEYINFLRETKQNSGNNIYYFKALAFFENKQLIYKYLLPDEEKISFIACINDVKKIGILKSSMPNLTGEEKNDNGESDENVHISEVISLEEYFNNVNSRLDKIVQLDGDSKKVLQTFYSKEKNKIEEIEKEDGNIKYYFSVTIKIDIYIYIIYILGQKDTCQLIRSSLIANDESVYKFFVMKSLSFYINDSKNFMLLRTLLFLLDENNAFYSIVSKRVNFLQYSLLSSLAAIMSRNMSHNIGSHALADLVGSDEILPQNEVKSFYRYLQNRMDFIAQITTKIPEWTYGGWFNKEIMRIFYENYILLDRIGVSEGLRAYDWPNDWSQSKTRGKIIFRTGLAQIKQFKIGKYTIDFRSYSSLSEEEKKKIFKEDSSYNIIIGSEETYNFIKKQHNCFKITSDNMIELLNILKSKEEEEVVVKEEAIENLFKDNVKDGKKEEFKILVISNYFQWLINDMEDSDPNEDIQLAIPGGIVGYHAFYSILENVLRNSAKHDYIARRGLFLDGAGTNRKVCIRSEEDLEYKNIVFSNTIPAWDKEKYEIYIIPEGENINNNIPGNRIYKYKNSDETDRNYKLLENQIKQINNINKIESALNKIKEQVKQNDNIDNIIENIKSLIDQINKINNIEEIENTLNKIKEQVKTNKNTEIVNDIVNQLEKQISTLKQDVENNINENVKLLKEKVRENYKFLIEGIIEDADWELYEIKRNGKHKHISKINNINNYKGIILRCETLKNLGNCCNEKSAKQCNNNIIKELKEKHRLFIVCDKDKCDNNCCFKNRVKERHSKNEVELGYHIITEKDYEEIKEILNNNDEDKFNKIEEFFERLPMRINVKVKDIGKDWVWVYIWDDIPHWAVKKYERNDTNNTETKGNIEEKDFENRRINETINIFGFINDRLRQSFIDKDTGKLRQKNWGMAELKICAGYLQQRGVMEIGDEGGVIIEDYDKNSKLITIKEDANSNKGYPQMLIKAIPVDKIGREINKLKKGDIYFTGYKFWMKKSKKVAIITDDTNGKDNENND